MQAVSALVVEDDLLMVESQNDGPAIAILPPPPEMTAEDDDQLMMESREAKPLASPERSAVDQHQFVMAANYLKNQFSIPHHLVPSYQDISRRSGLMKRRCLESYSLTKTKLVAKFYLVQFLGSTIFRTLRTTGLIPRYRRMMSRNLRNLRKIPRSTKMPIFIAWTTKWAPPRNRGIQFIAEISMSNLLRELLDIADQNFLRSHRNSRESLKVQDYFRPYCLHSIRSDQG